MKEKLYTIELMDAVNSGEECLFCYLERKLEQNAIEFVLGASYMESNVREQTDSGGFCRTHTKLMFDYGNSLGNAWILKSRMEYVRKQLKSRMAQYAPKKIGFLDRMKNTKTETDPVAGWIREQESHCYICSRMNKAYEQMVKTFVGLLKQEPEFAKLLMESPGFCLHHFADVVKACSRELSEPDQAEWMPKLFALMEKNLERVQEDINWLIEKYDYNNQNADWKTSKDALQRTMQKLTGGYPADPVFKSR